MRHLLSPAFILLLALIALPAIAQNIIYEERLPAPVARALKAAGIPQGAVGVVVQEPGAIFPACQRQRRPNHESRVGDETGHHLRRAGTAGARLHMEDRGAGRRATRSTACSPEISTSRAAATPS